MDSNASVGESVMAEAEIVNISLPPPPGPNDNEIAIFDNITPVSSTSSASTSSASTVTFSRDNDLGQLDNISGRLNSLITDLKPFESMAQEEIERCTDIEILRRHSLSLRTKNEMLIIQNQLLDYKRRVALNGQRTSPDAQSAENESATTSAAALSTFQEELFRKIITVLETEFNCCICSEVFIEPSVLECGHTFCGPCITQWLNERYQCPVCRNSCFRGCRKHVEMENFITKIYSSLSDDIRERRETQIRDRRSTLAADTARRQAAASSPSPRHNIDILRRIQAQLEVARSRTASRARHSTTPWTPYGPQTARRGGASAPGGGGVGSRAISDLHAEYNHQQRILARYRDLMRRREMHGRTGTPISMMSSTPPSYYSSLPPPPPPPLPNSVSHLDLGGVGVTQSCSRPPLPPLPIPNNYWDSLASSLRSQTLNINRRPASVLLGPGPLPSSYPVDPETQRIRNMAEQTRRQTALQTLDLAMLLTDFDRERENINAASILPSTPPSDGNAIPTASRSITSPSSVASSLSVMSPASSVAAHDSLPPTLTPDIDMANSSMNLPELIREYHRVSGNEGNSQRAQPTASEIMAQLDFENDNDDPMLINDVMPLD